ncbi:hypothetical protein JOC86_000759 [Bacillus pakistanensis]|uniref:Uncharacterized protein n=1 Tax=Rossellomorea pakistanensis TaxID=992288 RepID=A0ABS2N8M9_9BACI|nr:hypothetical protein [Bacillus pakistanensis]MBM7584222.1 hypothetical protein [Bacillus pakistanensis]
MGKNNNSKKLQQAVQHANETNPSSRSGTKPSSSKSDREKL